ncbi:hypothetical protein O6H91_18G053500 [Diphasiastrum complanatum]|uniref:Uncharacterized protein n=1 Tax=Diphasiastrum complanatum TaxID=34168 RepID=A0ACC2B197_DIPCM|nr:hypothetical protein O6H91_18G053500 [Diphasiastrum complanatum]
MFFMVAYVLILTFLVFIELVYWLYFTCLVMILSYLSWVYLFPCSMPEFFQRQLLLFFSYFSSDRFRYVLGFFSVLTQLTYLGMFLLLVVLWNFSELPILLLFHCYLLLYYG